MRPTIFRMRWLLAALLVVCAAAPAGAQRDPVTPAPGSAERKAIMDAVRGAVLPELKKNVVFQVDHLVQQGGYAFLMGQPRKPDGTAFDYRGTIYQEAIEHGLFDDWIWAVLAKVDGRWRTLEYGIGNTDVGWLGVVGKFGAPEGIFPDHGDEHDHH